MSGSIHPDIHALLARAPAERRLGPFVLVEQLGQGGFAPVWLARETYGTTELRRAAVKLFPLRRSALGDDTALRDRIVEEARALCRVQHPNVVRFYALPIHEELGVMGLAMEHAEGDPLDKKIARLGRTSVTDALTVGAAIASALAAVHRAGLVHRDVKPSNIVHTAAGYRLIDFGIAAADEVGHRGPSALPPDTAMPAGGGGEETASFAAWTGTLGYIDPVTLAHGARATTQSDLYGLGATLFECLVGKVPAAINAPPGVGLRGDVISGLAAPPRIRKVAPDVPAPLAQLVDGLLEPDPARRPLSAERVATELEQVRRSLAGLARTLPPESVGPFRGLGRFEQADRDVYFGRAAETAATLEMLRGHGLVTLIGPSGSGKSSLARAAVLPAVAEGALSGWPRRWQTPIAVPGSDPRAAILSAVSKFAGTRSDVSAEELIMALAEQAQRKDTGVLLLIDQLEELATLASGDSQLWAADLLAGVAETPLSGVRVVAAARRDLLDPLLSLPGVGEALVRGSVLIEPLSDAAWSDVLDEALGAYGYEFEDEALRRDVLDELRGTASAMPLVQFALTQLWEQRDSKHRVIRREGLRAIGGIAGALERHAEATLAAFSADSAAAEPLARALLLDLTTPHGTRSTRSHADLVAADPERRRAVDVFEQARLIVCGANGVTLAHEALLTQWGRLRGWVAEAKDDRLLAEELNGDAARWREEPESVPLWRRRRLAFAEELRKRSAADLTPDALSFMDAGRRAERRGRAVAVASALSLLGVAAIATASYIRSVTAQERATEAALIKEQAARRLADQRTREVHKAQDDIKRLVAELGDSPAKRRIAELQEKIQTLGAQSGASATRRPARSRPATAPAAPAAPAAVVAQPAATTIKVKETW